MKLGMIFVVWVAMVFCVSAQGTNGAGETNELAARMRELEESVGHLDAKLSRQMNELLWFQRLGDLAVVDKVRYVGPPPRGTNGAPGQAGTNEVVVSAMSFVPRKPKTSKMPLIVFAHGEIHGNVANDEEPHVIRELIEQGYAVIAPDYRGSSGYGADYWRRIDYGGLEIEDVHLARECMLAQHREIDPKRVGIVGWSHGGLIAMMTVFMHPAEYRACYAGVPVSDLEERIKSHGKEFEKLFSAPYHLGKTVAEAPEEYRRRSPAWNVEKLKTPLLIQANTSDEDVKFPEVEKLMAALKASGKDFRCHIYTNAPGGHQFNRVDTGLARESREEIWQFLATYLKPGKQER